MCILTLLIFDISNLDHSSKIYVVVFLKLSLMMAYYFLAETYSRILPEYNVVLTGSNAHLCLIMCHFN